MLIEIFCGFAALILLFYLYLQSKWTYWIKLGVYQMPTQFPWGTFGAFFTKKSHFNEILLKEAQDARELSYYGGYFFNFPVLMVKDANLVRSITVKDFEYFVDRSSSGLLKRFFGSNTLADKIWSKQMTGLTGEDWKNLRATISPIFTAGKMKGMFVLMQETCKQLLDCMDQHAESKEDFELKEILGKYSMDTIASAAFGIDAESFTNDKSKFIEYAKNIFKSRLIDGLKIAIAILPGGIKLFQAFNLSVMKKTETEFFYHVVVSALKHRKETETRRGDLIDLMLDAIKDELENDQEHVENNEHGQFEKDAKLHSLLPPNKKEFDEIVIVATAMVLLVAGYDTTGTTLAWTCYALSKNPDIQDKLRAEIEEITDGNLDKKLSYDDLLGMNYLDQVISETLRFYNPAGMLKRTTTKDYTLPGTDITIAKDTNVWINSIAIHFDSKNYSNPHSWDPDHFSKEAKGNRNPYAFLGFGQGPRGCIGMRFALLEAKLALANIVRRYILHPSTKTVEPYILDPKSGISYVKDGLFVQLDKRNIEIDEFYVVD